MKSLIGNVIGLNIIHAKKKKSISFDGFMIAKINKFTTNISGIMDMKEYKLEYK